MAEQNQIPIPRGNKETITDSKTLRPTPQHSESSASALGDHNPLEKTTSHQSINTVNSSGSSPGLSRNPSFSSSRSHVEEWDALPPLDRLSIFDLLENIALPQQLEKIQRNIGKQKDKVMKQRDALKSKSSQAKDLVVEEWRRRLPTADEQLDKYRKRMKKSTDKLMENWNDAKAVTAREKFSFITGVLNIFISGYLIGAFPQFFPHWYTVQLLWFLPIRYYTYKKRGFHYFLADLCYFVNVLLMLSIWIFPNSKRLFISTFCLAFGNNAVAIAMWRNSLVFHSLDKVTSLFIHVMPCVTLHCIVHLIEPAYQATHFPAIHTIRTSLPASKEHYSLGAMALWSSVPYAIWQLSYHFLITVRRRDKIAAGRPTSFTWLRKSYSKKWIGKLVLSLPQSLQEPAYMLIQYLYALLTMVPCPLWFWYRWASATFLMAVFTWSVYNGATYYIDVFGKRFQNELEKMKKEVAQWQNSPFLEETRKSASEEGAEKNIVIGDKVEGEDMKTSEIPELLNAKGQSTGVSNEGQARERKANGV